MKEVASGKWRTASARIVIMHIPPKCKRRNPDGTLVDYRPNSPEMLDMLTVLDTAKVTLDCTAHLHANHFDPASENHNYPIIMGGGPDPKGVPVSVPVITRVDVARGGIRIRQTDFYGKTVFEHAPAV